jgi:limonene-1,2-epoxide hydrolase
MSAMARMQTDATKSSSSSSTPATRVVEALVDAFRAMDINRAMELFADNAVYQNVPFPPDRGRDAIRRTLRRFARVANEFDVRIHHVVERDGVVLTERTDIIRGPALDLEFWVCGTFEVQDGKIVLWRDYFDLATVTTQLLTSPLRRLLRRHRAR